MTTTSHRTHYAGRINMTEARELIYELGAELGLNESDILHRLRVLRILHRRNAIAELDPATRGGEIGRHERELAKLKRAEQRYQKHREVLSRLAGQP